MVTYIKLFIPRAQKAPASVTVRLDERSACQVLSVVGALMQHQMPGRLRVKGVLKINWALEYHTLILFFLKEPL